MKQFFLARQDSSNQFSFLYRRGLHRRFDWKPF